MNTDNVARLINETQSFEGGGLVSRPQGGRSIATVTNLQVIRNQPQVGGGLVTLTWLQEHFDFRDMIQIGVYSSADINLPSNVNPRDYAVNNLNLRPLQSPVFVQNSPVDIFVPTNIPVPVMFVAKTRASNGLLSLDNFEASTTAFITPVGRILKRQTAHFTCSGTSPNVLYIADVTSATINATLPPIYSVIDGFSIGFKATGTTNVIAISTSGSDTIDDLGSTWNLGPSEGIEFYAEKSSNTWWVVSRLI